MTTRPARRWLVAAVWAAAVLLSALVWLLLLLAAVAVLD